MMCYKDMTFCTRKDCKNFGPCSRSLTEEVLDNADKWWGEGHREAPIARFVPEHEPECFEPKDDNE